VKICTLQATLHVLRQGKVLLLYFLILSGLQNIWEMETTVKCVLGNVSLVKIGAVGKCALPTASVSTPLFGQSCYDLGDIWSYTVAHFAGFSLVSSLNFGARKELLLF